MMRCVVLLGLQVFVIIFGNNNSSFGSSVCNTSLYKSVKNKDMYELHIAGVNLEDYDYLHVYQYVLVPPEKLFVLGYMKSEQPVLSIISLKSRQATVMRQYPWALAGFLRKANFTVVFLHDTKSFPAFILLEYVDGNISRNTEETVTYLEILRADSVDEYRVLRREGIAETSIVFERNSNPEFKYRYLPGESLLDETEPLQAATNDISKVLFCDVNDDSYPDILVWIQRYISRLLKDPGNEDFVLEKEKLSVMYFEPDTMTFSVLTPLNLGQIKDINDLPFWLEP